MPKNLDEPIEWVFLFLIIVLVIIGYVANKSSEKALEDPNDKSRIYLEQLPVIALLSGHGLFRVIILRQSGNLHAEYESASAVDALKKAMTTFRRAKIDTILVSQNTESVLHFKRLFYSHRGSAEGKKVGSVEITKIL